MPFTPDGWTWRVHYSDGATFDEYEPDGTRHHFREVDNPRVALLELVPRRDGLAAHAVRIDAATGMRPIFFRRAHIHCIGYQKPIMGWNFASYTILYPDGSSLITDDHRDFAHIK